MLRPKISRENWRRQLFNFQLPAEAKGDAMNLFIVEDSEIVREQMQSMLSEIPGIKVVGFAVDETGAMERIHTLLPDVVTLDLRLRTGSGINVLEYTKKFHPGIKVVVLTNYDYGFYADKCMRAGADLFFDKTFQFTRLYSALWLWNHGVNANVNFLLPQPWKFIHGKY
jgi:DNA-binding NarL/FixJ family response regulator